MNKLQIEYPDIYKALHEGTVLPAHPLALNEKREIDEKHQRALTRYYMASNAGGVAVGVHTTQFEIRDKAFNMYERVLRMASEEIDAAQLNKPFIKIAGICGPTDQSVNEARLAARHGYHLGLLSMGGLNEYTNDELIEHTRKVAEIIPVFGFYLQPAVGGRILDYDFWKKFVEIPNVNAIKVAAFNRYQTLDVVRAVAESERRNDIALYTGNDDNILADLLTTYRFQVNGESVELKFVGGLLGHWAVWTSKAVEMLDRIKRIKKEDSIPGDCLTTGIEVTDTNAVIFDASNNFRGCIPGIHEILRRQGLIKGTWCLNPNEVLSPGQMQEIDRIYSEYPHLNDDAFVSANLDRFLENRSE